MWGFPEAGKSPNSFETHDDIRVSMRPSEENYAFVKLLQ